MKLQSYVSTASDYLLCQGSSTAHFVHQSCSRVHEALKFYVNHLSVSNGGHSLSPNQLASAAKNSTCDALLNLT